MPQPNSTEPIRTEPARLRTANFEFRAADPTDGSVGDGRTLDGYAAVFNVPTRIDSWEGTFDEIIAPGAFKRTLRDRTPVMQFDHGNDARTGSVPIGTFASLTEDAHGLHVVGRLFDNDLVEPIQQAIAGRAITGMSFRFRVTDDQWTDARGKKLSAGELDDLLWAGSGERGPLLRTIRAVDLLEAGPVVFPAYDTTTVGVRSLFDRMSPDQRDALARLAQELRQTEDSEPVREDTSEPSGDTSEPADEPTDTPDAESTDDAATEKAPATPGTAAPTTPSPERATTMAAETTDDRLTVAERAARQEEIQARLTAIDNEYAGAVLPDDVRAEWDAITAEDVEHERAINDANERRQQLAERAARKGGEKVPTFETKRISGGRQAPAVHIAPENIYNMAAIRQQARSGDDLHELHREYAMRAVEQGRFPGVRNKADAQSQVEHLLNSVDDKEAHLAQRVLVTGSPLYQRAFGKAVISGNTDGLSTEERTALAIGADATGGYAVPFTLDPTVILTSDGSVNPLRQVSRVEQIVTKSWHGVTSAGVTVSRVAEATEATDNSPTLAGPTVTPQRVQGFVQFSDEIEMDWTALSSEVTMMLQDAKDQEEAVAFVTGTGTAPDAAGVISTLAAGSQVDQTGAAGAFTVPADLYKLEEELPPRFRQNASWLANKSIYNKIRAAAQSEAGLAGDLWVRFSGGQPPELLGYPAYELSSMADSIAPSGAGDNLILALGDFKRGFIIVDRVGMNIELVPHLFGAARRMPTGQRGLYAIWRNNTKVLVDNAIRVLNVTSAT